MIDIRIAVESDSVGLCRLNKEFNGEAYTPDEEQVAASLRDTKELIWIAFAEGKYAGFLIGEICDSICYRLPHGCVKELYVAPSFRRSGIGKMLLDKAENYFRQRRVQNVLIQTSPKNRSARRFYSACGYQEKRRIEYRKTIK